MINKVCESYGVPSWLHELNQIAVLPLTRDYYIAINSWLPIAINSW